MLVHFSSCFKLVPKGLDRESLSSATGWKAQCDLECTIRITKPVREPRNEMRQKLAYSNAGVSKVECPECATTRSLDGPLGDSTIPFPPKTKNQDLISKVRILKVLLLLVLIVANWVQVLLQAKLV